MCLKSCILTSGNPAFTLAVFQLVNIFMYGFFVFGDANRYLDCLVVFLLVCWLGRFVFGCLVQTLLHLYRGLYHLVVVQTDGIVSMLGLGRLVKECLVSF